jgi:murein DD-endopeptidase MepM/ murein hydrolase activator NlpD
MKFEIWIQESGREIHRQVLTEGRHVLGRSEDSEIAIVNRNVSRHHLRLEVGADGVVVTDLGSTNGTRLDGRNLAPNQPTSWPQDEDLYLGPLVLRGRAVSEPQPAQPMAGLPSEPVSGAQAVAIVCPQAVPQTLNLTNQPIYLGRHVSCAMRITGANVADHHCLVRATGRGVEVTNLDVHHPIRVGGEPLTVGQTTVWQLHQPLQIDSATFHLSAVAVGARTGGRRGSVEEESMVRRLGPAALLLLGGLAFVCLAAAVFATIRGVACGGVDPSCMLAFAGGDHESGGGSGIFGRPTPTLAPFSTSPPVTATPEIISFNPVTLEAGATVSSAPVDCAIEAVSTAGWLDVPFPYRGTEPIFGGSADIFRRLSQRSRFGGRLNAFFDHQFPLYPPIFGGHEPADLATTLVTFTGERVQDAYAQDSTSGDWYSGHAGIDYAPAEARQETTPVLAAADGRLALAKVDTDGNHMVRLEHDPDGDGRYDYATYYFHLAPDEHFFAMTELPENTPIQAGQRLGTMGTTGRSTGIHLHFEVRRDVDRNGIFSVFERVDPYGFFASEDVPTDPWAELTTFEGWLTSSGQPVQHEGIISEYLWRHPLVDVVDTSGSCEPVVDLGVKVDLFPVLGFAVINSGFTYVARDDQGNVLREGQPHTRSMTILPEYLDGVDRNSLTLQWLDPVDERWRAVTEDRRVEPFGDGGLVFRATVRRTGRYVLVAREVVDRVPPQTFINLDGEAVPGQANVFRGRVTVTLTAEDRGQGQAIMSGVASTAYSLDCGQEWFDYEGPFEVTLSTPHLCGTEGTGLQGISLGPNDFLLLAVSEDSENNIEQPAAQARFTVLE